MARPKRGGGGLGGGCDEWNVVDNFVISGIDEFFANFGELTGRVTPATDSAPADEPTFMEMCREHKDNIYSFVAPPM